VGSPLFGARVGHAQLFLRPISAVFGRPASDLCLGGTGVGVCPSRAVVRPLSPFPPLPAACFGGSLLQCRMFFSLFLGHSLLVLVSIFTGIFGG
jgi:hypothetical protein